MKKLMPIGFSDYKRVIEDNFYYVDKTVLIDDLLKHGGSVTLLPRPRRFGKTLNISMLKYFFEKTEQSNAYLFEDKKVWQLPECVALQGKFPVIFLTFKDIKENTWQDTRSKLILAIAAEYRRHQYVLESGLLNEDEKIVFKNICDRTAIDADYHESIKNLSEFLYRFHAVRTIVLIDEYDSPIHAGFIYNYYTDIIQFMRGFMTSAFKDNVYLERGVITGILRTAKEGIFSGLNNLEVFTILDDQMSDKFGFTESEIEQCLRDYDLSAIHDEFKNWYNGYLIGNTKVYNPWSALSCIKRNGQFMTYWANASDNVLISKMVAEASSDFKLSCADLIAGKIVENIKITTDGVFNNITIHANDVWSLLLLNGYVTPYAPSRIVEGVKRVDLVLPNKESHILLKQLIENLFYENLKSIHESGYSLPGVAE